MTKLGIWHRSEKIQTSLQLDNYLPLFRQSIYSLASGTGEVMLKYIDCLRHVQI